MNVWDVRLASEQRLDFIVPDGHTAALVVLKGCVRISDSEPIGAAEVGLFDRGGNTIAIDSAQDAAALLLSGEPIDEPIVGQGPFVMNSSQEIRQAIADYQSGKMGHLH
jgi:redox-sensitive bicupin YhaK (pirin superfamily)